MRSHLAIVFAMFLATPGLTQSNAEADAPAAEEAATPSFGPFRAADVNLADLQWINRPIVVFADTPADPRFKEQMELLLARPDELTERDVVLISDTDPAGRSAIRERLRPRGFMLVLIAKDGTVNLRKPFPWTVREISHAIDKWPMREQEIRDRNAGG